MDYEEPLFFRISQYAARADRDAIDMVSGNPDWDAPEGIRRGLREFADKDTDEFQYPASEGLTPLREEIADRRGVDREQVVVTAGTGEANYLAMAAALDREAGDEVILTDPVYPYYPGKTEMLDGVQRFVNVAADGTLDPDAVREVAGPDTACILVNTPNNPTGAVYDAATMEALVSIAEDRDALLVSDEVYDHFDYDGCFSSALAIDSDRRIVTSGYSKSMAITGFRVGYAIFPPELAAPAKTRHMLTNVTGSRPAQYAVLTALRETGPDYYEATRATLRGRIDAFTDALDAAGAEYTNPQGAFYVMARFPDFPGTLENVFRLIDEAGVACMPGEAFGSARRDWLRFALVTPRAEEAASRLADYFAD